MKPKYAHPTLVVTIKQPYFDEILAGTKNIEYRELKRYWLTRLETVGPAPFHMLMRNGMTPPVPQATVEVKRVSMHQKAREIRLHLGRVLSIRNRKKTR